MTNSRTATIGFAIFWLAILVILASAGSSADGLLVYAILVAFVGLRKSYLLRPNDDKAVMFALTFGAALNFGPAGAIIGVVIALAQSVGSPECTSPRRLLSIVTSGAAAGLMTGLIYAHATSSAMPSRIPVHVGLALLAAAVCYAMMVVSGLIGTRRYVYHSLLERLKMGSPLSYEFLAGITLAAGLRIFHALSISEQIPLVMPLIYLARQSVDLLVSGHKKIDIEEDKLADTYLGVIYSLVGAIDARDRFTRTHTTNVMKLSLSLARKMNLSHDEMEGLKMAALFHDIGKLWVPEHILLKPGRLNPDQFAKIQLHPALGQKILEKVTFPWPVGTLIRSHHERWDGTGYPDRLKGEHIPLGARILCLADVYDAMTSKRSYRSSHTVEETIKYIRGASGSHFDPAVIRAFEQIIADGDLAGATRFMVADATHKIEDRPQEKSEDISRTSSEFIAMFEIAQTASTSLNLDKVLYLLAGKIKSMISCSACVIFLMGKNEEYLEVKTALGANSQYFEGGRATINQGQTGKVAASREGMMDAYDRRDITLPTFLQPWVKMDDWVQLHTVMIVPIMNGDEVLGTINLYHSKQNAFSEEDFRLLTAVAPQVSKAIQNALLFKQTSESALTDLLTGVHNARYLFMRLEQELGRAKRLGKTVSVLGLDLDNFKAINDTFGHPKGDAVLKDMAHLFLAQVRDYDLVCRYAGDEFVIVLPDTSKEAALETARRIETVVDELEPYAENGKEVRVGVSVGAATYPDDGIDVRTLIARADVNMYEDKKRRKEDQAAA